MGAMDDKLDFYGADLGPSLSVSLTVASASSPKLLPRRYLVQFIDTGANRVWARVSKSSDPQPAVVGSPSTPFGGPAIAGPVSFEINVRPDFNDIISAIMAAGTGTMVITPISRVPK